MNKQWRLRVSIPIALLLLATAGVANQSVHQGREGKDVAGALQFPVTSSAGTFTGTFTINRFEARNNAVVAIGIVKGAVAGSGNVLAEVVAPVTIGSTSAPRAATAAAAPATTCEVLQLSIGAVNLNVQGIAVAIQPIGIDVSGDSSAPLGNLVCTIQSTLNNVVAVVGLLNQVLGLVTGLVGGVTGGLGGITGGLGG